MSQMPTKVQVFNLIFNLISIRSKIQKQSLDFVELLCSETFTLQIAYL